MLPKQRQSGYATLLQPIFVGTGDDAQQINDVVRWTDRLTDVFRCRMEQLEEIHRWLAGYLQAVGIMLQIPGAAEYRWVEHQGGDPLWKLIWNPDTGSTLSVLAAVLERLNASGLLHQVPGGERFERRSLSVKVQVWLAERDRLGLLNVAAECLDRLLVVPQPSTAGALVAHTVFP